MKLSKTEIARFRRLAAELPGLDMPAYAASGRDPLSPVLGAGPATARLCVFGRDPGREEVAAGRPFVGPAGRALREALTRFAHIPRQPAGTPIDDDALPVVWLSTVPYKRVANKAWPSSTIRDFQPAILDMLLDHWSGDHVLTLGTHAFEWFTLGQSPAEQQRMAGFWASDERYSGTLRVHVANERKERWLTLHPLPHPSPANAQWHKAFPGLLGNRLSALFSNTGS